MADISEETIDNLTKLSRIGCSKTEKEALLKDIQKILGYMEQLNEVDTTVVPACNHVLSEIVNVMRDDKPGPAMPRKTFLDNTQQVGGLVKIPPVIAK